MRFTIGRISCITALSAALLAVVATTALAQQQGSISGVVTDRVAGTPLGSVRVSVLNTNRSTVTNQQGHYTIQALPAGTYQEQASIIGYAAATTPATVTAGHAASLDLGLRPAAVSLDAVVITSPAGEQRARETGNSVTNIALPTKIENQSTPSFSEAISGLVPGVSVMQSGGTVGTGTRIRIRGQTSLSLSNEPVYYLDGIRVENNSSSLSVGTGGQSPSRVNDINPQDIENVEIVKGPSASTLYGTQAANGV